MKMIYGFKQGLRIFVIYSCFSLIDFQLAMNYSRDKVDEVSGKLGFDDHFL